MRQMATPLKLARSHHQPPERMLKEIDFRTQHVHMIHSGMLSYRHGM